MSENPNHELRQKICGRCGDEYYSTGDGNLCPGCDYSTTYQPKKRKK